MGNTVFYEEIKKENPKISWIDLLSDSFKKHSMKDLEYAFAAGSPFDTASTQTMLKKWHKPWVWTRVLILLSIVGFGFYGLLYVLGMNLNIIWDTLIVLTCITPISTMVLFWELDMARDVSFIKLLGCFLIGGLLSLSFTLILYNTDIESIAYSLTNTSSDSAWSLWVAPLTEEPAKLLAGLVILMLLVKGGTNIFGCTGIAVAAGVGTGFTLFESFGYVITYAIANCAYYTESDSYAEAILKSGLSTVKDRSIPGLNAHMLMCVPYIAMIALAYHETKDWKKSVLNKKTGIAFLAGCVLHGWWDCMYPIAISLNESSYETLVTVQEWIITALYLVCNLIAIRLCLQQAVREGNYISGQGRAIGERTMPYNDTLSSSWILNILSVGTILTGAAWQCSDTVMVGKLSSCAVKFPENTPGLSRAHCKLVNHGSYWTVTDLGSSYGTFLNGERLMANREYQLLPNSVLALGSQSVQLRVI